MKIKNLFFAAMALFAFMACTETPDAPYAFPGSGDGEGGGAGSSTKGNPYINETFSTGLGSFTTQQTVGNFPWKFEEYNGKGYAKVSGFASNASQNAESWLISPSFDLSNETKAFISFDYVINKGEANAAATNHLVLITDNFTGDVKTTQWTEIDYGAINNGTWSFNSTGEIELPASVIGKNKVVIAFKYISTTSTSSTWEMNNLIVNGEVGAPETSGGGENETNGYPYIQESFSKNLGAFATQQTVGNFPWKFEEYNGKGYAKVSGFANSASQDAESWLISPSFNLSNETKAFISFDYVINKGDMNAAATNHLVLITDNYTGDVANTKWTEVPFGAVNDNTWTFKSVKDVELPTSMIGKSNVVVAFKYISTTTASSTWEMNNLVINGEVGASEAPGEQPETPDTPDVPTGDNLLANGSFEDWDGSKPAYWATLATSNATIEQSTDARTGNYSVIVNGATTNKRLATQSYVLGAGTYTFSAYVKNNGAEAGHCRLGYVKISNGTAAGYTYEDPAASEGGTDWTARVWEFTLTEETELAFIVMNNKTGNGASFLVDDVTLTTSNGSISGDEEEPSTPSGSEYLNETFATSFGSFTTQEVIGTYAWYVDTNYNHAKVSGYANNASQNAESWLISPAMNLSGETAANISFDYVINKGDANAAAKNHKLLVTSNYTGDVTTTEWTEVNYGAVNNNNWTFQNTGNISLPSSVMGKSKVVVAFKYMSTTSNSSTWEVKNVVVTSATK